MLFLINDNLVRRYVRTPWMVGGVVIGNRNSDLCGPHCTMDGELDLTWDDENDE